MSRMFSLIFILSLAIGGLTAVAPAGAEASTARATPQSVTFLPTGGEQTFAVPAGVTTLHAVAVGGRGGNGASGGAGGYGALVSADLSVAPGQILYLEVGGNGVGALGGFNGGGAGGSGSDAGGGGGGASDIRLAPRAAGTSLTLRLLVAAGGGGGGGSTPSPGTTNGGGTAGAVPTAGQGYGGGGQPGTATTGGASGYSCDGIATTGSLGTGASGRSGVGCSFPFSGGGGGGAGLYGGGGGGTSSAGDGGGAGSSGSGAGATNTSVVSDTTGQPSISLTYAAGPSACTVPKLVGHRLKAARKLLGAASCKVGKVRRTHPGARWVVRQKPKSGAVLPPGAAVRIKLGDRPRRAH
ncbi:PASTA domain-containing protein [Nocardioides sp. QY071]|uniref:PASTA domain-containing protein n=1 Tax=Nocardioides sp. QY071 TaxID=3044187 RepID=UPI00249CB00B|nr:PASTA domain-containing protein [Nocardioides sp. QY071]WGY01886.1 PASTA domain-containing protein [Nocardioides sp. QY071]